MSEPAPSSRSATGHLTSPFQDLAPVKVSLPQDPASSSGSVRELLDLCWRHRRVFAATSVAVATAFYLNSLRVVPLYESRATLEANLSGKRIEFQEDKEYPGRIENGIVNTQSAKFLSTPVLARALEIGDLGEGPAYRGSDNPVGVMRSRVTVSTSRDSWAFDVSLRDEDGERSQRGLDSLLQAYFALLDERSADSAGSAVSFLAQQVEDVRRRLDEARKEEQSFRESHGINSADPDDNDETKKLTALYSEQTLLNRQLSEREALLAQIRAADAVPDEAERQQRLLQIDSIGGNPLVSQQQQDLFRAEAEAKELTQKYGVKHPRMKEKQLELDALRKQLADAVSQVRASILAAYGQLKNQGDDLARRISREKDSLTDYRANIVRLEALSQETRNRQQLLDELSRRKAQEEVVAKMNARQVTVINPPEPAVGPINVNSARSLAMAIFLGLGAGLVAALGVEKMDPRLRGSAAVREMTGLPLLGRVPRIIAGGPPEVGQLATAFALESYKSLRSTIRLARRQASCRRIGIVSPSPGDGKSTVTHHLASALADGGSSVLLVDGDMRHPSQDELFQQTTEAGLPMLLAGEGGVSAKATAKPNLHYLGVGPRPPSAADLLCSPALEEFLASSALSHDFIIIDTPPLNLVSDALIIAERCDELILVVRDFGTTRGALADAIQRLEPVSDKLIGFIVNAAREKSEAGNYYIFKNNA